MEETHLQQAKLWLIAAEHISNLESKEKHTVSVALSIHSIIKANDALTYKFLKTTAKRHDDARRLFEDLITNNFIKPEYSNYKQIIQDAINNKAKAEYKGGFFSKKDSEIMIRKAQKFINMVKQEI